MISFPLAAPLLFSPSSSTAKNDLLLHSSLSLSLSLSISLTHTHTHFPFLPPKLQQGQAGAARLLAELAAAQAERDALASDAAALKAAAERAEEGCSSCCGESSSGTGGINVGFQHEALLLKRSGAASPPPQATFLFDDLDLGPPAAAGGSRNAVAF